MRSLLHHGQIRKIGGFSLFAGLPSICASEITAPSEIHKQN